MNNDLDNYQRWQLETFGNILPSVVPESELFESGIDELNRLAEWIDKESDAETLKQQH